MANKLLFEWSKITDGNMARKYDADVKALGNRETWLKKFGINQEDLVELWLAAGTEIILADSSMKGKHFEADALITIEKNLPLFFVVGDCLPVVIYDEELSILALVHLGWPGVVNGLGEKVINMIRDSGFKIHDLKVKIGPGARKESYKFLHDELKQKDDVKWQEFLIKNDDGKSNIDLAGYLKKQMEEVGIKPENIDDCGIDTISDMNYFFHYRSKLTGEKEGRFGVIAMVVE